MICDVKIGRKGVSGVVGVAMKGTTPDGRSGDFRFQINDL